jgi:hypothetical protein
MFMFGNGGTHTATFLVGADTSDDSKNGVCSMFRASALDVGRNLDSVGHGKLVGNQEEHLFVESSPAYYENHSARRRKRGAAPKLPGLLVNIKLPLYIHIFIGIRLFAVMLVLPCSPRPGSSASATSVPHRHHTSHG